VGDFLKLPPKKLKFAAFRGGILWDFGGKGYNSRPKKLGVIPQGMRALAGERDMCDSCGPGFVGFQTPFFNEIQFPEWRKPLGKPGFSLTRNLGKSWG